MDSIVGWEKDKSDLEGFWIGMEYCKEGLANSYNRYFLAISHLINVHNNEHNSPCSKEIGAPASIRTCTFVCTSDCSFLLGIARAIQDFQSAI